MSDFKIEYRGRIGHIVGEARITPEAAKDAAFDALADYPFEFPERYDEPVIEQRRVTRWEAVSDD